MGGKVSFPRILIPKERIFVITGANTGEKCVFFGSPGYKQELMTRKRAHIPLCWSLSCLPYFNQSTEGAGGLGIIRGNKVGESE